MLLSEALVVDVAFEASNTIDIDLTDPNVYFNMQEYGFIIPPSLFNIIEITFVGFICNIVGGKYWCECTGNNYYGMPEITFVND